jgi:predicted DCC family thiol-disulfide oxidoreductase YuxK
VNDILKNKTILLFDGYCNLCHSSVQFVLKHEKKQELYFTSLQSKIGLEILKYYNIDTNSIDSLVLIEKNKAYIKSTAALTLAKHLKGLYKFGYIFIIVPAFIRNWVYDYIAKNRYKWFGKKDSCIVPDENLAKRFL